MLTSLACWPTPIKIPGYGPVINTVIPRFTGPLGGKRKCMVNRGTICMYLLIHDILGNNLMHNKSGYTVNRGTVNRGMTVYVILFVVWIVLSTFNNQMKINVQTTEYSVGDWWSTYYFWFFIKFCLLVIGLPNLSTFFMIWGRFWVPKWPKTVQKIPGGFTP